MKKKPKFRRQCFWLKKLGTKWRKPRGRQSKLRIEKKGRWPVPKIGYGSPKKLRGLVTTKDGMKKEVLLRNVKDLERINPKEQLGIIASSVGKRKSLEIMEKAKKMGIRIKNRKLKKPEKKPAANEKKADEK